MYVLSVCRVIRGLRIWPAKIRARIELHGNGRTRLEYRTP